MTIIVGVVTGSTVTIGGDSRYTSGTIINSCIAEKVWRQGPFVFGATGLAREGEILRYATDIPAPPTEGLGRWLRTAFIDAIRAARPAAGFDEKKTDGTEVGPRLMFSLRGRLFVLDQSYSLMEFSDSYAVGSGMDFALGSLSTTKGTRMVGAKRVKAALTAACERDVYCAPPFVLKRTRASR